VNEFQSALATAFEAGPAEVPELTIDQLDGRLVSGRMSALVSGIRGGAKVPTRQTVGTFSCLVEPVSAAAIAG
jgi:hypothetical protein